ncbi:MAG TPA: hypothetical protein VFU76_00460 [Terriglobales bacterium]|nr:hypothetical protein [Terriglobales bacterium]
MSSTVASYEEKRETGLSLEVIGSLFLFFDFLVLFFLPAGMKLGHQLGFGLAMGGLAGVGIGFIAAGVVMRARAR